MTTNRRGRGRPPAGDTADRRAAVLDAARRQFAERGFDRTSLRAIAGDAGVDPSLVRHYFGDKQGLLVATLDIPVDPLEKIGSVLAGPIASVGETLVRTFLEAWDPHREVFATLVRSTLTGDAGAESPVGQLVGRVIVDGLTHRLEHEEVDEARLRAAQAASVVAGLGVARYVLRVEPLASASVDDVAARHGAAVQALLDA